MLRVQLPGTGALAGGQYSFFNVVQYKSISVGDNNQDGAVDAADYVVWRKGFGTTYTQADYDIWRAHFGETAGSGSGDSANVAIPEPITLVLLMFGATAWCLRRRQAA